MNCCHLGSLAVNWVKTRLETGKKANRVPQNDQIQEAKMITVRKQGLAIYVDKSNQQWVVRDTEGNFWTLPSTGTPWEDRQSFIPTEDTELEPVPGHYKYMLGLPY